MDAAVGRVVRDRRLPETLHGIDARWRWTGGLHVGPFGLSCQTIVLGGNLGIACAGRSDFFCRNVGVSRIAGLVRS